MTAQLRLADRLAVGAALLMAVAAIAGLAVPDLYRDRPVLVEATRADNLFQLVVALPLLLAALVGARQGSGQGRVIAVGVLLYVAYFFGLYALAGVVTAATLLHVAVVGTAVWSLVLGLPATDAEAVDGELGRRLLRRFTIGFLLLVAGFHIPLWAGQILASAASGELPAALVSFGWLNTPVYTFDLAFAMPIGIVAAVFLARRDRRGTLLALSFAWFSGLLALDMVVEQVWIAATGGALDMAQVGPFGLITVLSAAVLAPTFAGRGREVSVGARHGWQDARS